MRERGLSARPTAYPISTTCEYKYARAESETVSLFMFRKEVKCKPGNGVASHSDDAGQHCKRKPLIGSPEFSSAISGTSHVASCATRLKECRRPWQRRCSTSGPSAYSTAQQRHSFTGLTALPQRRATFHEIASKALSKALPYGIWQPAVA